MKKMTRKFSIPQLREASNSQFSPQKGQALITLLFFVIIGITITSAAVIMIFINSVSGEKFQDGMLAYQIAESGGENGLLRVLRTPPPTYTGETISVGTGGQAVILVTGTGTSIDPYIITSTGQTGNFIRKIEITATYQNNLLSVTGKRELF